MKSVRIWFKKSAWIILCAVGSLNAESPDPKNILSHELIMLDELITATQRTLSQQIQLRDMIKKYQTIQESILLGEDSNEILFKMAKTADLILKTIKDNHLTQAFDPAFLGELTLVSKPASKRGIPKP